MKRLMETMKLEEGKVTICNIPFIITFTKSIYYTQKELENVLGEKWRKVSYDSGKTDALACYSSYIKSSRFAPFIKYLVSNGAASFKFCVEEFNKMGKGRLEIMNEDANIPKFLVRLYFSPIALAYLEHHGTSKPVCHHIAGIFAGAGLINYPGIEATETKCMAKGDPYCEFVIEIPKK